MIKLLDLLNEEPNREIKNVGYYQQILNINSYSPERKKYLQGVIDSVKKQNGLATPKQYDTLQRIKSGDFNYGKK
jgi:hypothetical protein